MSDPITVSARIVAEPEVVWSRWTTPADICAWNAASPEWHTPHAESDLREGGRFTTRMEARDGSLGFDLTGTWQVVERPHRLVYELADGRRCTITFRPEAGGTRLTETFDPEGQTPVDLQRAGWQSILDRFKQYVETA